MQDNVLESFGAAAFANGVLELKQAMRPRDALHTLHLERNRLTILDGTMLEALPVLAVLELSRNNVKEVGAALAAVAPSLSVLSMKGNPSVCALALTLYDGSAATNANANNKEGGNSNAKKKKRSNKNVWGSNPASNLGGSKQSSRDDDVQGDAHGHDQGALLKERLLRGLVCDCAAGYGGGSGNGPCQRIWDQALLPSYASLRSTFEVQGMKPYFTVVGGGGGGGASTNVVGNGDEGGAQAALPPSVLLDASFRWDGKTVAKQVEVWLHWVSPVTATFSYACKVGRTKAAAACPPLLPKTKGGDMPTIPTYIELAAMATGKSDPVDTHDFNSAPLRSPPVLLDTAVMLVYSGFDRPGRFKIGGMAPDHGNDRTRDRDARSPRLLHADENAAVYVVDVVVKRRGPAGVEKFIIPVEHRRRHDQNNVEVAICDRLQAAERNRATHLKSSEAGGLGEGGGRIAAVGAWLPLPACVGK